ncbi:MAG TPA: EGF domain-containing protein, partial [Myxococcota bacterium]|nr:EGF domain-containing protein [Myxococcota bacterium]
MLRPNPRPIAVALSLTLWSCGGEGVQEAATGKVAVEVAPLTLPGLVDACYAVTVLNEAEAPVWSRANLCASDYGDGRSALSYVGTCDATDTNGDSVASNTVVLTIEGLYSPAPITDFRDPCAAPYAPDGCRLTVPCRGNADARVEFNLTVMREANQGFFDVAVTFEDIFCSAKVDCAQPATEGSPARALLLVFDPATGERVPSIVWAFACTDGDPGGPAENATHLYMDDLVLRCGETRYTIDAADGPGNVYPGGVGAPAPIVQAMVFEGRETISNGAADADKLFWNVALGLNTDFFSPEPPALAPACVLETKATAHKGPLPSGVTPANTNYPYVSVSVPLNGTGGATLLCTQHPLDGEPPNDGVATAYTGPNPELSGFATTTFGNVLSLGPTGVESTPIDFDECTALAPCGANTICTDLSGGFACTCLAGYTGNPYTSGCVDIDECDIESDNCHIAATCTNIAGSFECDCLPGYDGDGLTCTDLDGCLVANGGCSTEASCENQPGPNVTCQCLPGYSGDGLTCTDLDGCLIDNGGCSALATCENEPGPNVTCECLPGYGGDGLTCADLNGCLTNNGVCSAHASCENQPGPNVICQCLPGFTGDGVTCTDVNECLTNNGGCSAHATCTNTPGSRTCACNGGFTGDGLTCVQSLVVSTSTTDYNVFAAAGSPSTPRDLVVTVNAGVTIGASSTAIAAFRTGALPAGSTVRLVNNGNIYGAGGRGGSAGDTNYGASAGSPGGDAIAATVP